MARRDREKAGLLSRDAYDNDAEDVPSDADGHTIDARTSGEILRENLEVFEDDYEDDDDEENVQDEKRSGRFGKLFGGNKRDGNSGGRLVRPSRRHRERRRRGEDESELFYEMEEGGEASESPSRSSSESDLGRMAFMREKTPKPSIWKFQNYRFTRMLIHVGIILLFLAFLYAAAHATFLTRKARATPNNMVSNGTTNFLPTTILISLDGFRADFLQRGLTPTLSRLIAEGVSPLHMLPSFPSVTFPNHYTMVTGLYPESHGIVGNTFWDPTMQEEFYYTHTESSMQPKWWGGDPLWATAEEQGVRTAVHMWPGSEAHVRGIEPTHLDKYNGQEELGDKVQRILGLIDLPGPDVPDVKTEDVRPQLIAAYVPHVDVDGHLYGPNSTEIRSTITRVDDMLARIVDGLQERNLTSIVNIVVVSDHGMATTDISRMVQLDDLINLDDIEHIDGWPLYGLRPKKPEDVDRLYKQLKEKMKDNPNIEIHLRDKTMPPKYHFSNNERIAPLWIIPKAGWAIVTKKDFDLEVAKKEGLVYHPRGLHGYDHEDPLMRAIFVARGPAFPHTPGSRLDVFQNTEIYNIICDTLNITPQPNNGTLPLPLQPVGLHSDPSTPQIEEALDPPALATGTKTALDAPEASTDAAAPVFNIATAPAEKPSPAESVSTTSPASAPVGTDAADAAPTRPSVEKPVDRPTISHENDGSEGPQKGTAAWWDWVVDKWEKAKDKLKGVFSFKDHEGDGAAAEGTGEEDKKEGARM